LFSIRDSKTYIRRKEQRDVNIFNNASTIRYSFAFSLTLWWNP